MKGMTLIELVIVVAVMGILLAIAIPSYSGYMLRVHRSEAISSMIILNKKKSLILLIITIIIIISQSF